MTHRRSRRRNAPRRKHPHPDRDRRHPHPRREPRDRADHAAPGRCHLPRPSHAVHHPARRAHGPRPVHDRPLPSRLPGSGAGLPDHGSRHPADPDRNDDRLRARSTGGRSAQRQGRAPCAAHRGDRSARAGQCGRSLRPGSRAAQRGTRAHGYRRCGRRSRGHGDRARPLRRASTRRHALAPRPGLRCGSGHRAAHRLLAPHAHAVARHLRGARGLRHRDAAVDDPVHPGDPSRRAASGPWRCHHAAALPFGAVRSGVPGRARDRRDERSPVCSPTCRRPPSCSR